jgi:hypothetical protein
MQVSEAALDDPALAAEARTRVLSRGARDDGRDAERFEQSSVLVVVIAPVGRQPVGLLAWTADLAGDRTSAQVFDQRDHLGDVVAVPANQADREWNAARVDEQMVL